jgi:hypothetical protein
VNVSAEGQPITVALAEAFNCVPAAFAVPVPLLFTVVQADEGGKTGAGRAVSFRMWIRSVCAP